MAGLEGQGAIVTGGARGIGRAITERLAADGARVSVWDLDPTADPPPGAAHMGACDVADEASIEAALAESLAALGAVDILVANAGVNGPTKPAWDYSLEEWNRVIGVDLTGVFLSARAVIPHMRARGRGRIVAISSIAGKEGNPNAVAYSAAKAGVIGLTKALAQGLVDDGILVNCVTPAMAETDLLAEMDADYIQAIRDRMPFGRLCTVEEIAAMVAFICGPECSFTTGMAFDISGGRATY